MTDRLAAIAAHLDAAVRELSIDQVPDLLGVFAERQLHLPIDGDWISPVEACRRTMHEPLTECGEEAMCGRRMPR